MCSCPPHLVETVSQTVSYLNGFGPFAGMVLAALAGSKIGRFLMKIAIFGRGNHREGHEFTAR